MKKTEKKALEYDETNIPGGSCMSGRFMTETEEKMVVEWMAKSKAKIKAKQQKDILRKALS